MNGLRICITACLCSLAGYASADKVDPFDLVRPCLVPKEDIEAHTELVVAKGWTPVVSTTDGVIEDLAWIHSVFYLSSDTGGEPLDSILELQRNAARGFLNKKDIPQSKSRFFQKETASGTDTFMIAWRAPKEGMVELDCRISLRSAENDLAQWPAQVVSSAPIDRAKPIILSGTRIETIYFDADRLPDHQPPLAVIHTSNQTQSN